LGGAQTALCRNSSFGEDVISFPHVARFREIPRCAAIALVLAALLVLPGCWVVSIHGLYEEPSIDSPRQDPDLVFDQSLTGSWSATEDKCTTLLTIASKDEVYDLQSTEQGEGCSDAGKKDHRQGRLVKLDTYYFLDVSPLPDDVCEMCLAEHWIFLVRFDKDTLSFTAIDSDWLKKSLAAKKVALATLPDDSDTIIASSKDLKAFCRKFAGNKAVFKPESTSTFKRT
jgi:hypothetical protein